MTTHHVTILNIWWTRVWWQQKFIIWKHSRGFYNVSLNCSNRNTEFKHGHESLNDALCSAWPKSVKILKLLCKCTKWYSWIANWRCLKLIKVFSISSGQVFHILTLCINRLSARNVPGLLSTDQKNTNVWTKYSLFSEKSNWF